MIYIPGPLIFDENSNFFLLVPPPCQFPADIVFVIDSSKTFDEKEFSQHKAFVKIMAKSFANNTRSAVVTYGERSSLKLNFDDSLNITYFLNVVQSIEKDNDVKDKRLDKAINLATTDLLPKARPIAAKLAVVVTDGSQTSGPNALELQQAFDASAKAGVRAVVLGVGEALNMEEWRSLVPRKEDFLQVENSQDLTLKIHNIATQVCAAAGNKICQIYHLPFREVNASLPKQNDDGVSKTMTILFLAYLFGLSCVQTNFDRRKISESGVENSKC